MRRAEQIREEGGGGVRYQVLEGDLLQEGAVINPGVALKHAAQEDTHIHICT